MKFVLVVYSPIRSILIQEEEPPLSPITLHGLRRDGIGDLGSIIIFFSTFRAFTK